MEYVKKAPKVPSFSKDGMDGYSFEIENKNISIDIEDVYKGHDRYCTNTQSTHIYYVLEGSGKFKINNKLFDVKQDDLIEIPKNTEFVFSGKMKLLLIMTPPFCIENNINGRDNDLYD